MGSCFGVSKNKLSSDAKNLAIEIFRSMDTDRSNSIDFNEAMTFWKSKFPKISSKEMFDAVDKDRNHKIELSEWVEFWTKVKQSGHTDEEITEELRNLKTNGWMQFNNVRSYSERRKD